MVPEKILFVIDLHRDGLRTPFKDRLKRQYLEHVKDLLKRLMWIKRAFSPKHEFGLACLTEGTAWVQEFSSDVELVADVLSQLNAHGMPSEADLGELFDTIDSQHLSAHMDGEDTVFRVVLIYSRAYAPSLHHQKIRQMLHHPRFFLDVMFQDTLPATEEPTALQRAMADLHQLNTNKTHVYRCGESLRQFYTDFFKLIGHPLSRPDQATFTTKVLDVLPLTDRSSDVGDVAHTEAHRHSDTSSARVLQSDYLNNDRDPALASYSSLGLASDTHHPPPRERASDLPRSSTHHSTASTTRSQPIPVHYSSRQERARQSAAAQDHGPLDTGLRSLPGYRASSGIREGSKGDQDVLEGSDV